MARKSDTNLDNMTLRQLKAYSDTNSAEGYMILLKLRRKLNELVL